MAKPIWDIIQDIKKYTSNKIVEAIRNNPQESRRELLLWLFEREGERNSNNTNYLPIAIGMAAEQ